MPLMIEVAAAVFQFTTFSVVPSDSIMMMSMPVAYVLLAPGRQFGSDGAERAQTRQWWRRVELNVTEFIHNAYDYSEGLPRFESRIPVAPEAAAGLKRIAQDRLAWLDGLLGDGPYLCGQRFTAADIWLYVWLEFGQSVQQPFDRRLPHVTLWFDRMAVRPSATQSREPFAAG